MRASLGMVAAAVLVLAGVAVPAWADDEAVPVRELPRAVRRAVEKKFPGAEIERAERETDDGKTVFEVTLEAEDDQDIDVELTPDGKILEIEREISVSKLPEAVRETLSKRYPGAKVRKVEAISRGDGEDERYEVLLSAEVVLTAKGKVVKDEDEDDDDGDDDDNDDDDKDED